MPRLAALLAVLHCLASVKGHSYLLCVNWLGPDASDNCADAQPAFERESSPVFNLGDQMTLKPPTSGSLCLAGSDSTFQEDGNSLDVASTGKSIPSAAAGSTIRLAWPSNNHAKSQSATAGPTVLVHHADSDNPTYDLIFDTSKQIASLPFDGNCQNYGVDWAIGGLGNDFSCWGDVQLSADLSAGINTFVWSWDFAGDERYSFCFQIDITGGSSNATASDTKTTISSSAATTSTPQPTSTGSSSGNRRFGFGRGSFSSSSLVSSAPSNSVIDDNVAFVTGATASALSALDLAPSGAADASPYLQYTGSAASHSSLSLFSIVAAAALAALSLLV